MHPAPAPGAPRPGFGPVGPAPSAWDRLKALGPWVIDAGLVLGVGLLVGFDLLAAQPAGELQALAKLGFSALALPAVLLRRRWPVAAFAAMALVILANTVGRRVLGDAGPGFGSGYGYWYPPFAPVGALGAIATPVIRRQAIPVAVAAGLFGAVAVAGLMFVPNDQNELVLFAILFGGTYVIGVGAGVYLRDLDRQQRMAADSARADERLDLARELHDLVAHYVTGIVVQAQAARVVADRDPAAAGVALDRIEEAGRDALGAMRRLVGSLRNDDPAAAAPTAPPVGLAGLDDLVSTTVAGGLPVVLTVEPAARDRVPGAVAASAHRIVQESLTNVRRHAQGAGRVVVDVRLAGPALVVTVQDDGIQPVGGHHLEGRGYGLVGMHERAQALGGTLVAGPVDPPGRGWRVQAVLPLEAPGPNVERADGLGAGGTGR